jgi:hypothetical protein
MLWLLLGPVLGSNAPGPSQLHRRTSFVDSKRLDEGHEPDRMKNDDERVSILLHPIYKRAPATHLADDPTSSGLSPGLPQLQRADAAKRRRA